ncbi:unnamed protein product, partial [Symbiodinium sp. CCMP2592]
MDGFVQVAELADPPVKLVIGPVDGNDTLCMVSNADSSRQVPKNIVMLWVGDGKLQKSQGEPTPGSLVYPDSRTQKGMCLDFESKTFSTLKDLARKHNVSDILGFRSFPPGAPGDLAPDSTTWVMESVNPLIPRLKLASDAIDHM